MSLDEEYIRDKRYIHETLEHNKKHTESLHNKFEDFKIIITEKIAIIQTKVTLYIAVASFGMGIAVNVVLYFLKGN